MLQQTRVEAVIGYYHRFLEAFPDVYALANADEQEVLKLWEGLGYYTRARGLHKAAQKITGQYNGIFPNDEKAALALPGVGAYTAGAVLSIAYNQKIPAVDGNVLRVISRLLGVRESVSAPSIKQSITQSVRVMLEIDRPGDFNQALMELGATVCLPRTPRCDKCPWQTICDAFAQGDAHVLPIKDTKRPKRTEKRVVLLVTYEDTILVQKRGKGLLCGMWEFPSFACHLEQAQDTLAAYGSIKPLGPAQHVFTHIIWEMQGFHIDLKQPINGIFHKLSQLDTLPFPVALRAYRLQADSWANKSQSLEES